MNLIRASDSRSLQLENQAKMVEERLNASEGTSTKLRTLFNSFSKKTLKYTDSTIGLASVLKELCSTEQLNPTLKGTGGGISSSLTSLADGRSHSTLFLDEEVVAAFGRFKAVCKSHRISMKNICSSKERESANRRRALIRGKSPQEAPNDDQPCHMQSALEDQALEFEKKKLVVLKSVFQDFVKGELFFHAQAVQILSDAFSKLSSFNVDDDFANFKRSLQETRRPVHQTVIRQSKSLVLRQRPAPAIDKLAFLDDESLRRINDRRCSERSSLATVPSDVLCSEDDDTSSRHSDARVRRYADAKPSFVSERKK